MKRLGLLVAAAMLSAGCASTLSSPPPSGHASSADPGASPSGSASSTATTASSQPGAAPTPAGSVAEARVTFDGVTCDYAGPRVLPYGTTMRLTWAPVTTQDAAWVGIMPIVSTTTDADLNSTSNPQVDTEVPWFVYKGEYAFFSEPGSHDYGLTWLNDDGSPRDTYMVICVPKLPSYPVGGYTRLHVVDMRSSAPSPSS